MKVLLIIFLYTHYRNDLLTSLRGVTTHKNASDADSRSYESDLFKMKVYETVAFLVNDVILL